MDAMETFAPATTTATVIDRRKSDTFRVWRQWSLARIFLLASLCVLLANGLAMGAWVGNQVEQSALRNDATITSLYVDSVVSPSLQPLATQDTLSATDILALDRLLKTVLLRENIVTLKVWSHTGQVLYSSNSLLIGRSFPVDNELSQALKGEVSAQITTLQAQENEFERQHWSRLVSVYVPVRKGWSGQVLAAMEFYQLPDRLDADIRAAQWRSWGIVSALTLATYLLLAGIVGRGSATIRQQRRALDDRVEALRRLLEENSQLSERVRHAANRTTTLNEQALRRISADLHDGPGQALALALMRMGEEPMGGMGTHLSADDHAIVRNAVRAALTEIRAISAGLLLPELEGLTVRAVIERAVRDHTRHTQVAVDMTLYDLPERAPLAVIIALFRALQEALSNATRHGKGIYVRVTAWSEAGELHLRVADSGPGATPAVWHEGDERHLGLAGMRERAQLLGGNFASTSEAGTGFTVNVWWPLDEPEDAWERRHNEALAVVTSM